MPIISQDALNILLVVLLVGCLLPSTIEALYDEPSIGVKIIVAFGLIVAPVLGLVYNLFVTIIGVLV